eukprot:1312319-Prymnesium_polylepis.1
MVSEELALQLASCTTITLTDITTTTTTSPHPVLRRSPMRALGRDVAAVTVDPQPLQMSTEPGSGSSIGLQHRSPSAPRPPPASEPCREGRQPPRLHLLHHHLTTTYTGPEGRQAVQAQAKHVYSQKARAIGHPAGVGGRA